MMERKTWRLEGTFRLKAPLSHIGETLSNSSYLVRERILQPGGEPEEVSVYSGNAWRGQLRDLAAAYLLDALGGVQVDLDTFYLLFSGGRIGGSQNTDIGQARRMRSLLPSLALFGGGVGNQILAGKLRVGNCYPVCREAIPVLPAAMAGMAARIAHADCIMAKEHSRRDDAKIEGPRRHLRPAENTLLIDGPSREAERDGPAQQMRIAMQLLAAGVTLSTWIVVDDATEIEMGALVSALHAFSASPSIGGKVGIGYGLVDLDYGLRDGDECVPFVSVSDGRSLLAPPAAAAKEAYDQHLRSLYDAMLADKRQDITRLLTGADHA